MEVPILKSTYIVVLCLNLLAAPLWSATEVPTTVEGTEQKEGEKESSGTKGHSVAPVIGYDPTFKFVVGAAYFYERKGLSFETDANWNFSDVYQWHMNIGHEFAKSWEYGVHMGITRGFDPYYAEGGETDPATLRRLWGTFSESRLQFLYYPTKIFALGAFADVRIRTEEPNDNEPTFNRVAPDESSVGVGLVAQVDTRDNRIDPRDGFRFETRATYVPTNFSTLENTKDFALIETSFIVYKEVLKQVLPNWVAAYSIKAGTSIGEPSYMFRYRLGGTDELRGYLKNRFRGDRYYLQQTELRFPIISPVGGAAFLAFGDATDTQFTNPKLAYGLGLRIGLPPDYVSQIRIDVGVGRDEWGVFADFGQTF